MVGLRFVPDLFAGKQYTEVDGQVEPCSGFWQMGRGQVDRYLHPGHVEAERFDGDLDAVQAFPYGVIGLASDKVAKAGSHVDLNGDKEGLPSVEDHSIYFGQHDRKKEGKPIGFVGCRLGWSRLTER